MKKLMISTIILLPLLLLAIMLVSGAIAGMMTHIYVESVEFVENDTLVLVMSDEENPPTEQLKVNIFPLKAKSRDLEFSVDDKNIASVDQNGVLTAKFYGETYISVVSSENKAASARRKVIITDTSVHKLVIRDGYDTEMYEGDSQQLSVTIYPQEAANKSVTWHSSDESILSVSANGTVTAKGAGTARITAISDDNEEANVSVEITCHKKISDIEVDQTLVVTSLTESRFPEVKPIPADADITLAFKTDKPDVATVDAAGNIHFKKEGHVVVTVTATDFGGKTVEKKKEYTSTDGYYLPPLFAQKEYTVDYDEYKDADKALPIPFAKTLDGSYREFISVKYSVDNVLAFDETAKEFHFVNPMPVGTRSLTATVKARIYDAATGTLTDYEDGFTLTVLRNATDISVSYKGTENVASIPISGRTLTFTEEKQSDGSFAVINATPENHTNKIVYSLVSGGDVAEITQAGVLTFNKEGVAKVKISLADADGVEKAAKEIDVIYSPLGAREQEVEISEEEKKLVLMMNDGGADTGVIRFVSPENATVTYTVEQIGNVVKLEEENGVRRIVPVKGGFATVKITVTPDATSGEVKEYTVKVYVDRPVQAEDFAVQFNGSLCTDVFRTSLDDVKYSVTVTDRQGSMAGKKLYVTFNGTRNEADNGVLTHTGTVSFAGKDSVIVTFGVDYSAEAAGFSVENGLYSVSRTVTTSKGTLDKAPAVTYQDGTLQTEGTDLTFTNIGEKIILTVTEPFEPADFDLSAHLPSIDGTDYVGVSISGDGATITLTAQKVCSAQQMFLAIGGKTFTLNVTVRALAEELTVSCGTRTMDNGERYTTLLDSLTFNVKIAERKDGQPISNTGVQYSLGGDQWDDVVGGSVQITVSSLTNGALRFRSADEGASMEFSVEKVLLGDFGLEFSVQTSSGRSVVGKIESIAAERAVSYSLPSDMQGALTIKIMPERDDFLGGFGTNEEFGKIISVTLPLGTEWSTSYEALQGEIIIDGNFSGVYTKEISLESDSYMLTVNLSHTYLASIEFTGFDSKNPNDNYLGYQQVRVFAKYSYYDGQKVNYLRIPVKALADLVDKKSVSPVYLTWSLTRYVGNEADSSENKIDVKQVGTSVTYNGKSYTIAENGYKYILQDENGKDVTDTATWVDVYSESEAGYARIYFGNFGGLAESDVQNDFFGNFGEQKAWTKKEPENNNNYDGSGRTFQPSAHAYSFLRVEAGDGAAYGKNCHFNFNVLEDSGLVNVFDATGYVSAGKKVVLHNNLYGPGELADDSVLNSQAAADGLILNPSVTSQNDDSMTKEIVYGNGYQINLKALNDAITALDGGKKNNSKATYFNNLYNVMLKGCNPTENINTQKVKIYLVVHYAYYCDLQYYSKLNGGTKVCLKNTVLRNVSEKALQMWRSDGNAPAATVYLENIVIVNAIEGITSENGDHNVYIKGFFDVLNYRNKQGFSGLFGGLDIDLDGTVDQNTNVTYFEAIFGELKDFIEWHGETPKSSEFYYANIAFSTSNMSHYGETNLAVSVWDDSQKKYVDAQDNKATMSDGSVLQKVTPKGGTLYALLEYMMQVNVWTSSSENSKDGYDVKTESVMNKDGQICAYHITGTSRDMSKLFTEDRYIRLLCEYKTPNEKNDKHILWHMQQVYRDTSPIIEGRKSHIEDLKDSLKGVTWPDGTKADNYINSAAAALNEIVSQAVIPGKSSYTV